MVEAFPIRKLNTAASVRAMRAHAICVVCRENIKRRFEMVSYYRAAAHAGCAISDLAAGARKAERDAAKEVADERLSRHPG